MNRLRTGWLRLRSIVNRSELECGLDEEIRFHIDQQTEKHIRAGVPADEARRRAMVQFGGVERNREDTRDEFRNVLLEDSLQDLRYGIRGLRRAPTFTVVAVATLALGIGAITAVFAVVHGVLIKPLPFAKSEELVSIKHSSRSTSSGALVGMTGSLLVSYSADNKSFAQFGIWSRSSENLTGETLPEEITALNASVGILRALRAPAAVGRWFSESDHIPGTPETVILTNGYWQRRFGGDASIIGRQITVSARPHTVIGVMPESFRFLDESPDVILPLRLDPQSLTLGGFYYEGLARMAPGVTVERATADLARIIPGWLTSWPSFPGTDRSAFAEDQMAPVVRPLKQALVGDVSRTLWILMGTVGIVLIIVCANVGTLVLVRAQSRATELAVRTALGARRARLAREMLFENLVLGVISGAVGLVLAAVALELLTKFGPTTIPRLTEVRLDSAVILCAVIASLLSAIFVGIIPAVRYTSPKIALAIRAGGRNIGGNKSQERARNVLVVAQVALTFVLLVGSGLLIRTSLALRAVDPGFMAPHQVQLARVTIPEALAPSAAQAFQLQREMRDRLASIPGVTEVSFTGNVPMANERSRSAIYREGETAADNTLRWFRYVSPGYFSTLGTRLIAGRDFTWTDLDNLTPVAIISDNLARELWREPSAAIGQRIREGNESPWREVVGVVNDVYDNGVSNVAPTIVYWPSAMKQFLGVETNVKRAVTFAIRTDRASSQSLLNQVREAVRAVNPNLPLTRVRTLGDVYERSLANTSFALVMLIAAAGIALFLGMAGVYSVIAYAVSQRKREIGIRVALGAPRAQVRRMFVEQGLMLGGAGVVCGSAGALVLTRLLAALLFNTAALDPLTYLIVSLGLAAIVAFASYVPAHRASIIDPVRALRNE